MFNCYSNRVFPVVPGCFCYRISTELDGISVNINQVFFVFFFELLKTECWQKVRGSGLDWSRGNGSDPVPRHDWLVGF